MNSHPPDEPQESIFLNADAASPPPGDGANSTDPTGVVEPATGDFPENDRQVGSRPRRIGVPGPGFWESVGWSVGLLVLHVGVALVVSVVFSVLFFLNGGGVSPEPPAVPSVGDATTEVASSENSDPSDESTESEPSEAAPQDPGTQTMAQLAGQLKGALPYIMGLTGLVTCLYGLFLCRFRLGRDSFRAMGWGLPSAQHLLMVCLLVIPMSALCTSIQTHAFRFFPGSQGEMEELFAGVKELPFPLLLVVLAVLPAIGEELLFRGVIGRGLLARRGFVVGMLITSVLFGLVHFNPAQILGVIPMGLAMHYVYAVTRSFWAPVLLHFLNNSLAAVMLRFGEKLPVANLDDPDAGLPLGMLASSAVLVCCLASWFWQTRVSYVDNDGATWPPVGADCGVPTATKEYRRESGAAPWWLMAASLAVFVGLFFAASTGSTESVK